jgi:hypothetical protein
VDDQILVVLLAAAENPEDDAALGGKATDGQGRNANSIMSGSGRGDLIEGEATELSKTAGGGGGCRMLTPDRD